MATESRTPAATLIEQIFSRPGSFAFVQAVRLLEQVHRLERISQLRESAHAGGGDASGDEAPMEYSDAPDFVSFRAAAPLVFPRTEIADVRAAAAAGQFEIDVNFLGLHGASGVLPRFYSEFVLHQLKLKNAALRDFLDIFNDRAIRNHLAASRKYRLPDVFELAWGSYTDPISKTLRALIGLGTPRIRINGCGQSRLAVADATLIYYAGLLSRTVRSAIGLEQLLSDFLGRPVEVIQLTGCWSDLDLEDQTRLPNAANTNGNYTQLGVNAVLGTRIFDAQGAFRVRLGPLGYEEFTELLPGSSLMAAVADLTRLYVGPTLAFEVQLSLQRAAVPQCVLGGNEKFRPRLGLNTWLTSSARAVDAVDVVMRYEGP